MPVIISLDCQASGLMETVLSGFDLRGSGDYAAAGASARKSTRNASGVAPPIDPWGRNVLNQCTYSNVATSTSSMPFHGPRLRISSAFYNEFSASAKAMSYESPFDPTEATASCSSSASPYRIARY